jgi:membrane protease subunit (stomatin/prohibitin family)
MGLSGFLTKTKYYLNPSELDYYHGVIVDTKENPIDSAIIILKEKKKEIAYTNGKGYFKLKTDSIRITDTIIIQKKGFDQKKHTTYYFHSSDYKVSEVYYFSRKEIDTIRLERITLSKTDSPH